MFRAVLIQITLAGGEDGGAPDRKAGSLREGLNQLGALGTLDGVIITLQNVRLTMRCLSKRMPLSGSRGATPDADSESRKQGTQTTHLFVLQQGRTSTALA